MPNLNKADYIGSAIESILSQDYDNLELVVVDNGSEDRSVSMVEELAKADNRVHLFKEPHRGVSFARNTGIRNSLGEFITFLDSDDICHERRLSEQVKQLQEDKDSVCYTEGWTIDGKGEPTGQCYNRDIIKLPTNFEGRVFHELVRNDFVIGGSVMASRTCLGRDPFDESLTFGEDWDLLVRLSRSHEFRYLSEPLYGYRVYPGNTWAKGNERRWHANYVRIFEKWLVDFDELSREERSLILKRLLWSEEALAGKVGMFHVALNYPSAWVVLLEMIGSSTSHRFKKSRPSALLKDTVHFFRR